MFYLQALNGGTVAPMFHSGVLFGEFFLLFNLALGGLVCLPNFIYLKYKVTSELAK